MSIIFPGTYYYSNMIGFKIEQEGRLIIYIYIYIKKLQMELLDKINAIP